MLEEIVKLLFALDPMNISFCEDEYEPEAVWILNNHINGVELSHSIRTTFHLWFDLEGDDLDRIHGLLYEPLKRILK
jgi:hypothetical protein